MSSPAQNLRIGVDLGGTKTEAVVVELGDEPKVLARERVPTARELGYEHIVQQTSELVRKVANAAGIDGSALPPTGVGMPGSITMRGEGGTRSPIPLVKNSNTTCLNGRPFRRDLSQALGFEVAFANDANCFALAEARWGAARGARVVFGVIMGTGVGGGVVLASDDGAPRSWDGAQSIAGEWGHVVLDPIAGPPCYCGRRGCIEQYLSGPAIEAAYEMKAGARLGLREVAVRANDGETLARELLGERVEIFGRALAVIVNVLDPDVVVLGGGVSNLEILQREGPAAVARWVFNDELTTSIVPNTLGDSAGVLGATLLPR